MLSIIVAFGKNNVIGKNNSIPWHIPEDLKRFKELTMGKKIIMGRKTFESLPFILPGRKHLILSTDKKFKVIHNNVEVFNNLDQLINKFKNSSEEVFIIGGGEIYKKTLNDVQKFYITRVHEEFDGDSFFPKIDFSKYKVLSQSPLYKSGNITYNFIDYSL